MAEPHLEAFVCKSYLWAEIHLKHRVFLVVVFVMVGSPPQKTTQSINMQKLDPFPSGPPFRRSHLPFGLRSSPPNRWRLSSLEPDAGVLQRLRVGGHLDLWASEA